MTNQNVSRTEFEDTWRFGNTVSFQECKRNADACRATRSSVTRQQTADGDEVCLTLRAGIVYLSAARNSSDNLWLAEYLYRSDQFYFETLYLDVWNVTASDIDWFGISNWVKCEIVVYIESIEMIYYPEWITWHEHQNTMETIIYSEQTK